MNRPFRILVGLCAMVGTSYGLCESAGAEPDLFARDPSLPSVDPRGARPGEGAVAESIPRVSVREDRSEADERSAIPPVAARHAAIGRVRGVYENEYSGAKSAQAKATLAKELLQQSAINQDPAERWALLEEAGALAINAGDVALASQVMQQVLEAYRIDRSQTQLDIYQRLLRTASGAQVGQLGRPVLSLVGSALKNGEMGIAQQAAGLAASVARKARDPELIKASNALRQEIKERAGLETRTQSLKDRLQDNPGDRDASHDLGLILYLNDLSATEGLRLLQQSTDPALVRLAKMELGVDGASGDKGRLAIADGWYDWARSATGAFRTQAEARALALYLAISPTLQGLESARVAKRINELQKGMGVKGVATPLIDIPMGERTGGSALFLNGLCNGVKFTVIGKEWPRSLFYAPKDNSTCIMKFGLPGTHRRLQGHAGIFTLPDTRPGLQPGAALIFAVWADGREVWRSKPLANRDEIVAYSIDVAGARNIELHTTSTGVAGIPWAAWLDPELVE